MNPSSYIHHPLALVTVTGLVAFGASAIVVGSGCTVLTNDALPDDAGVFEGGDSDVDTTTCSTCVANECTAPWALCLTNDSCIEVRACAAEGDATSCACDPSSDGGATGGNLYRAFTACNDARSCAGTCTTSCSCGSTPKTSPAACDQDGGTDPIDAATRVDAGGDVEGGDASASVDAGSDTNSCAACANRACDSATAACAVGSECAAFLTCMFACTDSACIDACAKNHATGKVAAIELATCTGSSCGKECGL